MMGLLRDSYTIYLREMLIFKSNIRTNMVRSITFPLIILLFFGTLGSGFVRGVSIAVVNYANNPQSQQFVSYLSSQNKQVVIKSVTSQSSALAMLDGGSINMVVVILPNFPGTKSGSPSVDLYYTNSFASLGNSLQFVTQAASYFGADASASSAVRQGFIPQSNSNPQVSENVVSGATGSYEAYLAAGVISMVVVFGSIFGGGISLITDRQLGNLKAFLIAPIRKEAIVLGKIASGTTQSIIYGFAALAIALILGVRPATGPIGYLWMTLIIALLAIGFSGITIILASKINKVEVYAIVAQMTGLPLWFISGGITPINTLPGWLAALSVADPLTYSSAGMRSLIISGYYPLSSAIVQISILAIFAIICVAIAMKIFKGTIE